MKSGGDVLGGLKDQEAREDGGQKRVRALSEEDQNIEREEGMDDQNGFPILLLLLPKIHILISVSNRKDLILVLRALRRHDYTLPASPARRGGIWLIYHPHEGLVA